MLGTRTVSWLSRQKCCKSGLSARRAAEAPIIFVQEDTREIAAQGTLAVDLARVLGAGADWLLALGPTIQIALDELPFQSALAEQLADAPELLAQVSVIDIALDGGQDLRERRLERNNRGV